MKLLKKICVYSLVGMLLFSSIVISYEKANKCEAASLVVEIGGAVVLLGFALYGCYYVSQPENQEEIKESLTNYKDMTVENAKVAYAANKKIFEDFVDYATANNGGSSGIYTSSGQFYSVDDMKKEGFPSFEKWDEEMKKQEKPSAGGGNIWDKLSFGLDLLDFIIDHFGNEDSSGGLTAGGGRIQEYYTGDDGYIDRETGMVDIRTYSSCWLYVGEEINDFLYTTLYRHSNFLQKDLTTRYAAHLSTSSNRPVSSSERFENTYHGVVRFYCSYKSGGEVYSMERMYTCKEGYISNSTGVETITISVCPNITYIYYGDYPDGYTNYNYISTNVPLFATEEDMLEYLHGGNADKAINLPPVLPTEEPSSGGSSSVNVTPVSVYCNHFSNRSVTPANVINTNYIIANNWDGTVENLTYILENSDNDKNGTFGDAEEELTPSPVPTLTDVDGNNTTNNYIINITNILQPIQNTVNNIYNFFIIDTEEISLEINNLEVLPTDKFNNFVNTFAKLKNTFSDDVIDSSDSTASVATVKGIEYPIIKVQSPKIIEKYVPEEVKLIKDGKIYIILCDCSKYAVQFSAVRTLLKAVIWFGFIFYLLRELKVVITLAS